MKDNLLLIWRYIWIIFLPIVIILAPTAVAIKTGDISAIYWEGLAIPMGIVISLVSVYIFTRIKAKRR